ncbi:MAG: SpoVA/SpoVAEb family sporulation membrane protein [Clostridia bacterium]|nr:SpoVA/SpoVAEb family sporulation membrane protein [Clostridia bacterium]
MNIDKKAYKKFATARATKTNSKKNCTKAFLFGGTICLIAQVLKDIYSIWQDEKTSSTLVSVTLIFITALLTGIGVFDRIAKHAGAGTLVPITGFANAVASPAVDSKGEGFVLGVGAKIFTIAGPVILYGTAAGVAYGGIYWVIKCITGA